MQCCKSPSIAVYANTRKPKSVETAHKILNGVLGDHACHKEVITGAIDPEKIKNCSYLMVVGGDGTILSAVRELKGYQIPIIGVNVGKLGFLARFSVNEIEQEFDNLAQAGLNAITDHKLLNCQLFKNSELSETHLVVNEVAVVAGPPFRMVDISLCIGDNHLPKCSGDGMIISTPIGSTAYNLSAGGPILESDLDCVAITPLAAHSLNFRPIVVGIDKPITVTSNSDNARVLIDGQTNLPMGQDECVKITLADFGFKLVQNPHHSQWQVLNQKLHWGRLPDYNDIEQ